MSSRADASLRSGAVGCRPATRHLTPARPIAEFLLALADADRLRIVFALADGELTAAAIARAAGTGRGRVLRQLAKLRWAGIVACRRNHGLACYRVANRDVFAICRCVAGWLAEREIHAAGRPASRAPKWPPGGTTV